MGESMKEQLIHINTAEVDALAEMNFIQTCGLDQPGEKYEKMKADGFRIRDKLRPLISIKALVKSFEGVVVEKDQLSLEGLNFKSIAFEKINPITVKRVYMYGITLSDITLEWEDFLETFYADAWGVAYIDAGRRLLETHLFKQCKEAWIGESIYFSDSFGPGFYGMDVTENKKIFQVLDGSKIGVVLNESCMMIPEKSCSGIYFATTVPLGKSEKACVQCRESVHGCQFCHMKK